jgi:cytochrome d ubiquinol oxidase subunit II
MFPSLPAVFSHHGLRFLLAVISGITTETLLMSYRFLWVQIAAAGTVTLTITGFAAAMSPHLLMGQLPLAAAEAPSATLRAFFSLLVIDIIILMPSLQLLY